MTRLSDRTVFHEIASGDRFANGGCMECGHRGGLFTVRGRYVVLCPWCAKGRIDVVKHEHGGLPEDVERLRREVVSEVNLQLRRKAQALPVEWQSVWCCDECGDRMHRFEVRLVAVGREPSESEDSNAHEKVCYPCYLIRQATAGPIGASPSNGEDPLLPLNPAGFVP